MPLPVSTLIAVLVVGLWVWRARVGSLNPLGRMLIAVVAMSAIVCLGAAITFWVGRQIWPRSIPGVLVVVPLFLVGFVFHFGSAALGRLREFWPTTFVIVGFASLFSVSERQFHTALERAARLLEPQCVTADSFFNSMRRKSEFQTDLHAVAIKSGELYAWSFAEGDFYKVPESARYNVSTHPGSWFSLPYPTCR